MAESQRPVIASVSEAIQSLLFKDWIASAASPPRNDVHVVPN
jgi:hypothetical protein